MIEAVGISRRDYLTLLLLSARGTLTALAHILLCGKQRVAASPI